MRIQGSSANWKIRVVGNMQGKLYARVCVCLCIYSLKSKHADSNFFPPSFFRLRCLLDTISHLYLSKFTPGSYTYACSSLFLLCSSHHPNLSHAENRKLSKQTRNNNNDDDDDGDEKRTQKKSNACINTRMCDFITQPVIECVSFLTFNTLLYTRRG